MRVSRARRPRADLARVPTRSRDGPRPSLARVDRDRPRADASLHPRLPSSPVDVVDADADVDESEFEIPPSDAADDETRRFDAIIGALEDFMMREDFAATQAAFCREHCAVFEDTEENRLEYTPIFEEYTAALETAIDAHLTETVEGFDMMTFAESLEAREGTEALEGEVFELLATLSSFEAFKELMLSYKAQEEGAADGSGLDLGVGLGFGVSVAAAPVVGDEQTDGEERPDLDDAVVVTAADAR